MKLFFTWLLFCICLAGFSQTREIDSLNVLIAKAKSDTQRINLVNAKIRSLTEVNIDSAIALANVNIKNSILIKYLKGEADARVKLANNLAYKGAYDSAKHNLQLADNIYKNIKDTSGITSSYSSFAILLAMQNQYAPSIIWFNRALVYAQMRHDSARLNSIYQNLAISYQMLSDFPKALIYYQKALKITEQLNDVNGQSYINLNIGITYKYIDDTAHAEQSFLKAISQAKPLGLINVQAYAYSNLATLYSDMKKYKQAYDCAIKANQLAKEIGDNGMEASALSRAAVQLAYMRQFPQAETMAKKAILIADSSQQQMNIYQTNSDAGSVFSMEKKYEEAITHFEKAFSVMKDADLYDDQIGRSYFDLSECYEKTGNFEKALSAYKKSSGIKDSITSKENIRKSTELTLNYDFDKKQQAAKIEQQKKDEVAKTKQTALIIGLLLTVVLAVVALNGYRNKQKANYLLEQQKTALQAALSDLKITQTQLIHSEKMASLGELTAGIAHEIQNPLNFVNNFAEVNNELIDEMHNEIHTGNDVDEIKTISSDIKQNNEKITFHGKRADAIVKGMLQHSRQTKGMKELTDINALCDEYLRLSYHGLRAKDKSFNANYKTDFDETAGKINIVPQDIGRVFLNLFNNAFYATNEKQKAESLKQNSAYKPLVSVQTKKTNNTVEISVSDNGNGISQHITDKIFQPFFTTKPTGQGTGLGLSLAYDIITKEHNGTIKVESKEGEGSTFIIQLK